MERGGNINICLTVKNTLIMHGISRVGYRLDYVRRM